MDNGFALAEKNAESSCNYTAAKVTCKAVATGNLSPLSEQQFVDCDTVGSPRWDHGQRLRLRREERHVHGHFRPGIQGCVDRQRADIDVAIEANQSSFLVFSVQRMANSAECREARTPRSDAAE